MRHKNKKNKKPRYIPNDLSINAKIDDYLVKMQEINKIQA